MSTETTLPALRRVPDAAYLVYERTTDGREVRYGAQTEDGARDLVAAIRAARPDSHIRWSALDRIGGVR